MAVQWQRAVGRRRLIVLIVNIVYQKKLEIENSEKHIYGPLSILISASIEGIVDNLLSSSCCDGWQLM